MGVKGSSSKIEDYYSDGEEFLADYNAADDAVEASDNDSAAEFLAELDTRWTTYGMRAFLSVNQYEWLRRLADS